MIATVLAFLLTIGVLIVVHEYGHYRVAVACNVKVLRFSIGFGRTLFMRRLGRDGTEFAVSVLPLGGYVRMLDEREGDVPEAERERAFNRRPLWQRSAIVAAGPAANLLLAVVLYAAAQWYGVQEPKALMSAPAVGSAAERAGLRSGDWVREWSSDGASWREVDSMADLRWQTTQAALDGRPLHLVVSDGDGGHRRQLLLQTSSVAAADVDATLMRRLGFGAPYAEPVLGEVMAGGPAAEAGLRKGDRVLRIDGRPVEDAHSVRERIRSAVDGDRALPMRWTIERAGQVQELTVTPRVVRAGARASPPVMGRVDAYVGAVPENVLVRQGLWDGIASGVAKTWEMSALTVKMIARMLIGEASVRNLSGPITIADYAGQSVQQGLAYYLTFLALVSVSLGVLNLLPLPMLDGGHLMYHFFEAVTGRPVPDRWLERLQRGGIAVLLVMMSVALFNDVARLLGLH